MPIVFEGEHFWKCHTGWHSVIYITSTNCICKQSIIFMIKIGRKTTRTHPLLFFNLVLTTDDITTTAKKYLHVISKRIIYIYRINI